ncbi:MAG TPA: hypothetical protein VFN90_09665 [Gemmatimonadales bacterium]|nr:hypothetical protein [Gemmatimonadales bacterium]
MRRAVLVATVLVPMVLGAQRPAERRCQFELVSSDRELVRQEFGTNVNLFVGGNVRLRCIGQNVRLEGDSVESFNQQVIRVMTRARYVDQDIDLRADTLTYTAADERLIARGSVRIVNRLNGSTLDGTSVDYLRAVKGIRDSAEVTAINRPTIRFAPSKDAGDTVTPTPYVVVADRFRGTGSSLLWGWGGVTIDRDSLRGRGDSLRYVSSTDTEIDLFGNLASFRREGADSFEVIGRQVVLGVAGEVLRRVRAYGEGRVRRAESDAKGDSVALAFTDGKLERTIAWGRASGAEVRSGGYDIFGDSVDVVTPGERLRELVVVGRGVLKSPLDSAAAADSAVVARPDSTVADSVAADSGAVPTRDRDTLWGNQIRATFEDVDSAGTLVSRPRLITAHGEARSLFSRLVEKDGTTSPSITYTRADTILIYMKGGDSTGVSRVVAIRGGEPVDGVQLEQASLGRQRPSLGAARREEQP